MRCPYCSTEETRVIDTRRDLQGNMRRRRECVACSERFSTIERPIITDPMVIKRDGRREPFDRYKLLSGLQIACARRAVSMEALERIVDQVEYTIRQNNRAEILSRTIGDLVIEELRKLDEVAYMRYAIVYLGLSDLEAVRDEIDRLRAHRR